MKDTHSYSSLFSTSKILKASIQPRFLLLFSLIQLSIHSFGQTTYNFSTAPALSNQGGFYTTLATVIVDGVSYKLTHLGNGNFSYLTNGGNGNSACLKKDGSGGDFLQIERTDGVAFQFYGMWLNSASMYNPPYYQPPYYDIKYYDQNGSEITSETSVSNVQNETVTISKNLKVKMVKVTYNAIMTFKLDDLIVGPAAASAPSVTTASINQFTSSSCMMGGNVTDEQLASVTDRGVVFNTSGTPTVSDNKRQIGSGAGAYSQNVTGLNPATQYYVRSYAINSAGTTYGTQYTFTTASPFNLGQTHYFNTAWVSTTGQATPFTKWVEGWNITATGTGTGLVAVSRITGTSGTAAAAEGAASARAISSTSTEDLVSMSVKTGDNSRFDLQSFKFKYLTKLANTAFGTITVTGYLNGTPVPGAVASLTNIPQATSTSYAYSTFDLTANNNFNSIDQFVVTAADPASGARLSAIDLDVLDVAPAATLPVKLQKITASMAGNSCILAWTTAQEQNTRDFDVEYSADGTNYNRIGSVSAAGNSNQSRNYTFTHSTLSAGNNFYRLRMNDIDNRFEYSQVVGVKKPASLESLNVYPNPVKNGQLIVHTANDVKFPQPYRVMNAAGTTLQQGSMLSGTQKIDVSSLKTGSYLIVLNNGQARQFFVE